MCVALRLLIDNAGIYSMGGQWRCMCGQWQCMCVAQEPTSPRCTHAHAAHAHAHAVPRAETCDGFESHMGCNHLGHFLLTLRLLPSLEKGASSSKDNKLGARVVK